MREQTIAMYCFLDDLIRFTRPGSTPPPASGRHLTDAQVLTTALVAARFFGGNLVAEDLCNEASGSQQQTARRQHSQRPHHPAQSFLIQYFRKGIETCFSQLTARFPKQIHAVTAAGFALKIALLIFAHVLDQVGL